jgi:hypothetical protein
MFRHEAEIAAASEEPFPDGDLDDNYEDEDE